MKEAVGLIAGDGELPLLLASGIRSGGRAVVAVAHRGATATQLRALANAFHWVDVGELGKIVDLLHREGVKRVVFAGGIPKTLFFTNAKPDARAIRVLSRLKDKKDDAILRAIADDIESEGIRVVSPIPFLKGAMAVRGCWTARKPTEREERDIAFGWSMAKRFGRLDFGQSLVVKEQMVLAAEAVEGTDETIRRGGKLGRGDVTVIKICKPNQDRRLDLPVIGPDTVKTLRESGASALVVEAGKTIVLHKDEVVRQADEGGICLLGM